MGQLALFIIVAFSLNTWAQDASVAIPLKVIKKPAADLIGSNGAVLDVGEASQMAERGIDLSVFDPQENRLWQKNKYEGQSAPRGHYPRAEIGIRYLSTEAMNPEIYSHASRASAMDNPKVFYRLTLSRRTHNTLMRAVLLRKLGYYIYNPKYYHQLRVFFRSENEKEEFINEVNRESVIVDMKDRKWIIEDDTKNHSLLLTDVILEIQDPEYYDIANGTAPDPFYKRAQLQRLSRYRAFRALLLPYMLMDIPESINRYSPKFGSVLAGHLVFTYPYAQSFGATAYEDMRWLMRRLLKLSEQDYKEIVAAGYFPEELNALIYAKLIHRVRNAAELLDLNADFRYNLPALNINSKSGLVKDGKVMRETVEGYPIRFAHGEREAPFKDGDFMRYLGIRGKTSFIASVLGEFNKKLQVLKIEDVMASRQKEIQDRIINHIKTNPTQPLYQKLEAWGGPIGGFNVSANRNVATGAYFDSTAPVQLVDNFSIAGSLGYFMALDGVPDISPFKPIGTANIGLMRDYTHVRPIKSMEEAQAIEWKTLLVPTFMAGLTDILDNEKVSEGEGENKIDRYTVDVLLSQLQNGEVFTVTDSVITSAYAQLMAGLDALMGISPLNFINTLTLGADANRVVLRQTSIVRTKTGLQVFVRRQNGKIFGMSVDVNYFVNIMKIRAQTQLADLKTDAFVVDYSTALSDGSDGSSDSAKLAKELEETRGNLRPALAQIFKNNDASLFYSSFPHKQFKIDHQFKTNEVKTKFLFWHVNSFNEDHWATILYPIDKEAPDLKPEDEKVVLFSNKKGQLVGRDLLGLGVDTLEAIINKKSKYSVDLGGTSDPNPANTPFGKAYWRVVNTEADFSPKGERFPSISLLSHVWGGWKMKRDEFFRLIDEITGQFDATQIGSYRLIEKEAFMNVKTVDFYRINALLAVLPSGVNKIRDLITQPGAAGKKIPKAKFLSRVFQKLSQKLGDGPRPQEKEMFNEIVTIIGNGDKNAGAREFQRACHEHYRHQEVQMPPGWWRNGNNYDCLVPWMEKLMELSTKFPQDEVKQIRWMTEVLWILDEYIPMAQLLKYLGEQNFIFTIRINGFRTGDEDADRPEYFSNSIGDPKQNIDYANGLFQMFANKTRIMPIEIDRSLGGFK